MKSYCYQGSFDEFDLYTYMNCCCNIHPQVWTHWPTVICLRPVLAQIYPSAPPHPHTTWLHFIWSISAISLTNVSPFEHFILRICPIVINGAPKISFRTLSYFNITVPTYITEPPHSLDLKRTEWAPTHTITACDPLQYHTSPPRSDNDCTVIN